MRLFTLLIHNKELSDARVAEVRTAIIEGSHGHFIHTKTVLYSQAEEAARDPMLNVIWIDLRPDPYVGLKLFDRIRSGADDCFRYHSDRIYFVLNCNAPRLLLATRAVEDGPFGVIDSSNWSEIQDLWNRIVKDRKANEVRQCRSCERFIASPDEGIQKISHNCLSCTSWLCHECEHSALAKGVIGSS